MKNIIKSVLFLFLAIIGNVSYSTIQQTFVVKNTEIVIEIGNIVNSPTQAIVNAANEELIGGSGVCGAIFKAAGQEILQSACDKFPAKKGIRCPVGEARITDSFGLQTSGIHYIIHAVGPDCRIIRDTETQDTLLINAYKNSLILADEYKISSIAFPFISSGIYNFPKDRAAHVALKTVVDYIESGKTEISSVLIVVLSSTDFDLLCKTLHDLVSLRNF